VGVLFTFPGQGAQRPGMLHALPASPQVHHTLSEASDTLARDVLTLDSAQALESSFSVQLALLVAGVAMSRCLAELAGPPDAVAGLSIGAYPAAVVAGALRFADALRLVERRAGLMEAAFPSGYGMTAVLGLALPALEALVAEVHAKDSPVYVANVNEADLHGEGPLVQKVRERAKAEGGHVVPVCGKLESELSELGEADKVWFNLTWHRLKPWPDSVPGLTRIKKKFIIATLSNGTVRLLTDMAKHCGLPWDTVLGSDLVQQLAAKTGMSQQDLMSKLSSLLPGVVDKLTPDGILPKA